MISIKFLIINCISCVDLVYMQAGRCHYSIVLFVEICSLTTPLEDYFTQYWSHYGILYNRLEVPVLRDCQMAL